MNKGQGTFQFSALFLFYPSILMVSTNYKLALHPYLPPYRQPKFLVG